MAKGAKDMMTNGKLAKSASVGPKGVFAAAKENGKVFPSGKLRRKIQLSIEEKPKRLTNTNPANPFFERANDTNADRSRFFGGKHIDNL